MVEFAKIHIFGICRHHTSLQCNWFSWTPSVLTLRSVKATRGETDSENRAECASVKVGLFPSSEDTNARPSRTRMALDKNGAHHASELLVVFDRGEIFVGSS